MKRWVTLGLLVILCATAVASITAAPGYTVYLPQINVTMHTPTAVPNATPTKPCYQGGIVVPTICPR